MAKLVLKKKRKKQHELVAFLAMYAVDYQKFYKLNGLHPRHYDLMEKYGARMDDFRKATNANEPAVTDDVQHAWADAREQRGRDSG